MQMDKNGYKIPRFHARPIAQDYKVTKGREHIWKGKKYGAFSGLYHSNINVNGSMQIKT